MMNELASILCRHHNQATKVQKGVCTTKGVSLEPPAAANLRLAEIDLQHSKKCLSSVFSGGMDQQNLFPRTGLMVC